MSEMISNYFFLTHSYDKAVPALEQVLERTPFHPRAMKKLVIAYIETGRLRDGVRLFEQIFERDPQIVLDTDPLAEDCPCPQLVEDIHSGRRFFDDPANRLLVLGIYSSYCESSAARTFFQSYLELMPDDLQIARILTCLDVSHC